MKKAFIAAAGLLALSSFPASAQFFSPPNLTVNTFGHDAGGWRVDRHPRLTGDVNGDGRDDIVGFGDAGAWVSLGQADGTHSAPVLRTTTFGYNAGGWRVNQHPRHLADVNGDGRDDIVGFGNAGAWVALGQADGGFGPHFLAVNNFGYNAGGWRVERHPRELADVNGDGRDDIVGFGNAGAYVSLGQTNGSFAAPVLASNTFGYVAGGWRVERHPRIMGDVNGDGRADVVGFGNAGAWVALGQTNGTFGAHQLAAGTFGYNAGGWRVERHPRFVEDVNGDGREDVIGFGNAGAWVALGQTDGNFGAPFLAVANYGYDAGGWRTELHPRRIGDVNNDNRADVVGFGTAGVWVSQGRADGRFDQPVFTVANYAINAGGWRTDRHPRLLSDVNGDDQADILGFGNAGAYVSLGGQPRIHDFYVRRHINSTLTNADADRILADATTLLQNQDGLDDVATNVLIRRAQGVDTFNTGNGVIQTPAQLNAVFALDGDAKVVNSIQECGGPGGGIIGCAPVPGASFVVVRLSNANQEGSLWAHEFGHNQGNPHRNGVNLVMNPFITNTARRVNAVESARFTGPASATEPTLMAAIAETSVEADADVSTGLDEIFATKPEIAGGTGAQLVLAQATGDPAASESDEVIEFISRLYVAGVPYVEATRFTEESVPALTAALENEEMKPYWANAATVLGIIGGDAAADTLIAFAKSKTDQPVDTDTFRAALDSVLSLGYVINRAPNEQALAYLSDKAGGISSAGLDATPQAAGSEGELMVTGSVLANSAVLGLSLGARPETLAVLTGLAEAGPAAATDEPANTEIDVFLADALATHEAISEQGLSAFYDHDH